MNDIMHYLGVQTNQVEVRGQGGERPSVWTGAEQYGGPLEACDELCLERITAVDTASQTHTCILYTCTINTRTGTFFCRN